MADHDRKPPHPDYDEIRQAWQREAAELRNQAAQYSPRGARQAYLRGEASALDRCVQALKALREGQ